MDNEEYLKKISAKPLQKAATDSKNKFLSPDMIKILACGLVAIILLIVVMNILGQSGARAKTLTETLYTRLNLLSGNNGPIDKYNKQLNSSNLRALTTNLKSNLANISRDLEGLLPNLNIDRGNIPPQTTDSEKKLITDLTTALEKARLNAVLDHSFAREMALQISLILNIQSELYERTNNRALQDLLLRSDTSLRLLEIEFTDFINSSR